MLNRLYLPFAFAIALGLAVTGCSSTYDNPDDVDDDYDYIDDETLEAFNNDLMRLSLAIQRADEEAERSLTMKISESARLYQRALVSALYDDDSTARRALASAMLGFTGDSGVIPPLLEKVNDEDEPERVRLNAVLGLSTLGDKLRDFEQHGELMRTLSVNMESSEASYRMRRASILTYSVAFDKAQKDSILPLRNRFLSDPNINVQIAAINALGDIGEQDAVPDLAVIGLDHPDSEIRAASAVALGKIEDPARVLPALEDACNDESAIVRRQAVDAISKHYGSDPDMVYATIVTGMSDFDERVRESAAIALARVQDTRAIEPLSQATGDRTALVRAAAATALGDLIPADREEEAYPLVELLTDQDPTVKEAALSSLTEVTREDFGGEQTPWQKYFWEKYPDLDPKNAYGDGPKPRVSSGISGSSSRRTSTPRTSSRTSSRNSNRGSNRNTGRTDNNRRR